MDDVACENPDVFSRYAGFTYVQAEDSLFLHSSITPQKNVPTASEMCHEKPFPKDEAILWFWSLSTLQVDHSTVIFRRQTLRNADKSLCKATQGTRITPS